MKVQVNINRSSAIAAGRELYGRVTIDLPIEPLSERQRNMLVRFGKDRHETDPIDIDVVLNPPCGFVDFVDPTTENLMAELDRIADGVEQCERDRQAEELKRQQTQDAMVTQLLSRPFSDWAPFEIWDGSFKMPSVLSQCFDPRVTDLKHRVGQLVDAANAEVQARRAAQKEEEELAKARTAMLKEKAIREAIEAKGDKLLLDQFDEDLMCEDDQMQILRDYLFPTDLPYYEKLTVGDVCTECKVAKFRSVEAETVPTDLYIRLNELRKAIPRATIVPRSHTGSCGCGNTTQRYGLLATIPLADDVGNVFMKVSREFA